MIYYKIVYNDGAIDLKAAENIDDFLEDKLSYEEEGFAEVVKIEKDEYTHLKSQSLEDDVKFTFSYAGAEGDENEPFLTEKMSVRITIINSLSRSGSLPTIEELDKYYDWVIKG